MTKEEILYRLKEEMPIEDADFDELPLETQVELIDMMSIEELMRIKKSPIKPRLQNYDIYSDYPEYYDKNMSQLEEE